MSGSKAKTDTDKARRRRGVIRDVLLGVFIGLALVFAAFACRYIYGKSKDPDYRLADLFRAGSFAESIPAASTLPGNDMLILIPPAEAGTALNDPETGNSTEAVHPPASEAEETPDTEPGTEEAAETAEWAAQEAVETTLQETAEPTAQETPETAPEETPAGTREETAAVISDPSDIRYHLKKSGMEEDELGSCRQLIAVCSVGTQCSLYFFEKADEGWKLSESLKPATGIVGRNGVTTHKVALDGCTPAGFYGLGPCYGEYAEVQTKMEYRQITEHDLWIGYDDAGYYNELIYIEDFTKNPWISYEHLIDYMPYYRYLAVIRYNMDPVVPYAGAAIFLHCDGGDKSTSGCVGTGEDVMRGIFAWLDPECDPHILIY